MWFVVTDGEFLKFKISPANLALGHTNCYPVKKRGAQDDAVSKAKQGESEKGRIGRAGDSTGGSRYTCAGRPWHM